MRKVETMPGNNLLLSVGFIYLFPILLVQADDVALLNENRELTPSDKLSAYQHKRIRRTGEFLSSINNAGHEKFESGYEKCRLTCLDKHQRELFKQLIVEKGMIRFSFTLNFENLTFTDPENSSIVNANVWTLFYDGKDGSKQYLYWPIEAMVWSFGLLSISSDIQPRPLTIAAESSCRKYLNLRAGENTTNNMIGQALMEMTNKSIGKKLQTGLIQKMYWCYIEKAEIYNPFFEVLCQNIFCPLILTQYTCCPYRVADLTTNLTKQCRRRQFRHANEWWSFPFILGIIMFIYSPFLILLYASAMVRNYPEQSSNPRGHNSNIRSDVSLNINQDNCRNSNPTNDEESGGRMTTATNDYITYEVGSYPVTIFGTLLKPFQNIFPKDRATVSRFVRTLFPFLCLSLIFAEILIDLTYLKDYVESCVEKSIPLGFRTMVVGIKQSRQKFLSFLGGPYLALAFYIGFSWISLLPPKDCGEFFSKGLQDYKKAASPLYLPIAVMEILGSVEIYSTKGYEKVLSYMKAHVFMLLNGKFWHLTFLIYKARFRKMWKARLPFLHNTLNVAILVVPALILCTLCLVETAITIVCYGCPVICFGIICTNSVLEVFNHLTPNNKTFKYNISKLILAALFSVIFLFAYYIQCLIFLESFLFLTRVAMFTYSGVIRYPRESYGVITLVFMTLYYVCHSCRSFCEKYAFLLEITIKVVKKLPKDDKKCIGVDKKDRNIFIARDFYEYVITHTRPRRVQMLLTIVKTAASLSLVSLSAFLVRYFDKYRDLSVIIQVLTIMLVCALPMAIRTVCSQKGRDKQRYSKMKTKIRQIAQSYIEKKKNAKKIFPRADDLLHEYGINNDNEYENII